MPIDLTSLTTSSSTAPATQPTEVVNNDPFASISLQKDMVFNLQKAAPSLQKAHVGLQWDTGDNVDLDLSVFALHQNGKIQAADDFLFFDQSTVGPGLQKSGDNRTGAGDGDDEWLDVTFASVKPTVDRIVLVVNIYEAQARRQNFGLVRNAMVHIDDADSGRELARFALTDDYSTDTSVIFGELVRSTQGWSFQSIGEGAAQDLQFYLDKYK